VINPLRGKTLRKVCLLVDATMGRDLDVSPIFFCLETPGQDQVTPR